MSEEICSVGVLICLDPKWYSILPPISALLLALITKSVILSITFGVLLGTFIYVIVKGQYFPDIFTDFFIIANEKYSLYVILFTLILGSVIYIMSKAGGTQAYGKWSKKTIKKRWTAELSTCILGTLICFDDYFSTIASGAVMRPVSDELYISHEKLAYLVDSLGASMVVIQPISTWSAVIISSIASSTDTKSGLISFLKTIPHNYYAILCIFTVYFLAITDLDFGPMRKYEEAAKLKQIEDMKKLGNESEDKKVIVVAGEELNDKNDNLENIHNRNDRNKIDIEVHERVSIHNKNAKELVDDSEPTPDDELSKIIPSENGKIYDLVAPILFLIIVTIIYIIYLGDGFSGSGKSVSDIFGDSDASLAMTISSSLTLIFCGILYLPRKLLSFNDFMNSIYLGMNIMIPICVILTLAWTIGGISYLFQTGEFLGKAVENGNIPLHLLPFIVFVLAALLSFSIGTAWGTFGILLPIVPNICRNNLNLLIPTQAAVISGSIFGDHCSPISDTTVMSSSSTMCKHMNHVSTQLPYACVTAFSAAIGYLINGFTEGKIYIALPITLLLHASVLGAIIFCDRKGYFSRLSDVFRRNKDKTKLEDAKSSLIELPISSN